MIASLAGLLAEKTLDHVVVDVGGVGYRVVVSMQTLADLPTSGEALKILCYTHVREDAIQIFGFLHEAERQAFVLLISVSGIGPKLALTILSGLPIEHLIAAISSGDHKRLQAIPGVGKKTAERLVVELRDKVLKTAALAEASGDAPVGLGGENEAVEALCNLGYKRALAEDAVAKVLESGDVLAPEQLLRRALAKIAER